MTRTYKGRTYKCVLLDGNGDVHEPDDQRALTMSIFDHLIAATHAAEGTKASVDFQDRTDGTTWKFYVEAI